MKMKLIPMLAILACSTTTVFAGISAGFFGKVPSAQITGDYVEARTASVFCGACHYNSEILCGGRDGVMAWNFQGGVYQDVNIAGVKAMADVTADASLGIDGSARHAVLAVDSSASDAQVAAVKALIEDKCGKDIGTIVSVTRTPITFTHHDASGYAVEANGFASLNVSYRTDDGCCTSPGLVWYDPLSPISHRKVGFTESVKFMASSTDPWQREGEDSAFYGAIAF